MVQGESLIPYAKTSNCAQNQYEFFHKFFNPRTHTYPCERRMVVKTCIFFLKISTRSCLTLFRSLNVISVAHLLDLLSHVLGEIFSQEIGILRDCSKSWLI